ncbi:hypothetical protein CONCODRAFT_6087 [Conidiobolus coronatus NRRL 28638]|uniref:Uncharacterized protein n=1 Tax=Conidiobolus coronatus (strain ATCC 28846 / CBS 209.66 / NRRL 28638) TaxID=796925 RepID=A0A137P897_CONC2|nr:hypothetical protein CONCODRAFT_6087 [Conidiobolus coronatus NRRL 28638]|eukprot:KXN71202.1 hypothetical protein CONCODRAFT_6087 [Conidiobolus coronatus NRRL 28638]
MPNMVSFKSLILCLSLAFVSASPATDVTASEESVESVASAEAAEDLRLQVDLDTYNDYYDWGYDRYDYYDGLYRR